MKRHPLPPVVAAFTALSLFLPSVSLAKLTITEFLTVNLEGPEDKDGDYSAWVEIYNDSTEPVNLQDWHLTDEADDLTKWRIPRKAVPAQGYALIYASGKDFGSLFNTEVHSSFKLGMNIEYLALVDPDGVTVASAHEAIPRQRSGFSFGITETGESGYFRVPTPLEPNGSPLEGFVGDTKFSVDRGFYTEPIQVEITTGTPGATIIYTTSGREPSRGSIFTGPIEHVYDGPITISQTTVLRAAAFKDGLGPSDIDTQTYVFRADVIEQPTMRTAITQSPDYRPLMDEALSAVPSLSIALEDFDLIANGTSATNDEERPISLEWLNPDGTEGFQVDAGMSRFGGYYTNFPKKSFRLYFRRAYGTPMLEYPLFRNFENGRAPAEEFDSLNLRSGSHDMNQRGAYMSNRFVDDTMLDMGGMAPHGRFIHVYLNGIYWGQYHLRERWNAAMHASYFGGSEDDYDAINGNDNFTSDFKAFDGTLDYWREVEGFARTDTPWAALQGHVDLADYFDFMMVWACGNSESEFQAVGSKTLGVPFTFYMKDADGWLLNGSSPPPDGRFTFTGPGRFNQELRSENDLEFKIFLADRIHKHFFNKGALTPERNIARLQKRVDEIRTSFIAESARWNNQSPSSWRSFQDQVMERQFPILTDAMIKRFKRDGFYPDDIQAPLFNQFGGPIEPGFVLKMFAGTLFNPENGEFNYTTDGSDPRLPGGLKSESALTYDRRDSGLFLDETVTIKARTYRVDSETWSPLTEATFHIGKRPLPGDLIISEIHYRPALPSSEEIDDGFLSRGLFEFIEIYNRSDARVSLSEVAFNAGLHFEFSRSSLTDLAPGAYLILVRDRAAFERRYGTGLPVAGVFDNFKLSDSGERLRLSLLDGAVLQELRYNDKAPWPEEADGDGPSLTLIDPASMDGGDPAHWTASARMGGSPGTSDAVDPATIDQDGDGLSAFLENALGSRDDDPTSGPASLTLKPEAVETDGITRVHWSFETTRNAAASVVFAMEVSSDLQRWSPADTLFLPVEPGQQAPERLKWRSRMALDAMPDERLFVRLRVSRADG